MPVIFFDACSGRLDDHRPFHGEALRAHASTVSMPPRARRHRTRRRQEVYDDETDDGRIFAKHWRAAFASWCLAAAHASMANVLASLADHRLSGAQPLSH